MSTNTNKSIQPTMQLPKGMDPTHHAMHERQVTPIKDHRAKTPACNFEDLPAVMQSTMLPRFK